MNIKTGTLPKKMKDHFMGFELVDRGWPSNRKFSFYFSGNGWLFRVRPNNGPVEYPLPKNLDFIFIPYHKMI